MYGGLFVLALWRCLFFYRCCGIWLSFLNYTSLLYVILSACLVYTATQFYSHVTQELVTSVHLDADIWSIGWLRPFVLGSPGAVFLTVILCWFQTEGHVFEIHKDLGTTKHDRAVQIIALPSVFAVMCMASMVPIYELVTGTISTEMMTIPFGVDIRNRFSSFGWEPVSALQVFPFGNVSMPPVDDSATWARGMEYALWRYETCFYVGDIFEAWALYQFGLLALELVREDFAKREASENEADRTIARELLGAHSAVSSLAWLGTMSFVIVCVGQTACSLYPYLVGSVETGATKTENILLGFQIAGFVASTAAIYNVFVVERSFHDKLKHSSPVLKFLSVKILVSLSFFQKGILVILQQGSKVMPGFVQKVVHYVPVLGDIVNMSEVQLHMFYPALIMYECLLTSMMHFWAWTPEEEWYCRPSGDVDVERQPLLDARDKASGQGTPSPQPAASSTSSPPSRASWNPFAT